jgi:alpha-D-ribose 1-methylphosphonate 5-phosphate C-P lyase
MPPTHILLKGDMREKAILLALPSYTSVFRLDIDPPCSVQEQIGSYSKMSLTWV